MIKRLTIWVVLVCMLTISACDNVPTPTTSANIPQDDLATMVALATQVASSPEVVIPVETATPEVMAQPTSKPADGSLTITSIVETAPGKAIVSWDAIGDFPAGYKVVWSDVMGLPTFPEDTNVYTSDPYARSAMISGTVGKIYYVRVCRFTGAACDIYSNLGIFAYQMSVLTPLPTITLRPGEATATKLAGGYTPKPPTGGGTVTPAISIVMMKGGEDGKAYMLWSSNYNPVSGFKIVYSTSNKTPTYGTDPYFYVPDGKVREGWVDGTPSKTYYYRVCGWTGSKCEVYSPTFTYTFAGTPPEPTKTSTPDGSTLQILLISDDDPGAVQVDWSAVGSFPNGYKVVFSQTNPLPTMADGYVYISSPTTYSAIVTGLEPGKSYYFRVCKYYGGNCTIYSPVVSYTVAAAAEETGFVLSQVSNVVGSVEISWIINSDNANGYKVMWSTSNPSPTMADSYFYVTSPTTHNYVDTTSTEGTTYYRVCRWSGSYCLTYSNALTVNIVAAP